MAATQIFAEGALLDFILLACVTALFVYAVVSLKKVHKKITNTEKQAVALQKYQNDIFEGLDKRYESLRVVFVDKVNKLTNRVDELTRDFKGAQENIRSLKGETEDASKQLKALLGETDRAFRKVLQESRQEIERMGAELGEFSKEIQKLKDDIREHTIDLEL